MLFRISSKVFGYFLHFQPLQRNISTTVVVSLYPVQQVFVDQVNVKVYISVSVSFISIFYFSALIKTERNKQTYWTIAKEEKGTDYSRRRIFDNYTNSYVF